MLESHLELQCVEVLCFPLLRRLLFYVLGGFKDLKFTFIVFLVAVSCCSKDVLTLPLHVCLDELNLVTVNNTPLLALTQL
jgi:hypothetical protein